MVLWKVGCRSADREKEQKPGLRSQDPAAGVSGIKKFVCHCSLLRSAGRSSSCPGGEHSLNSPHSILSFQPILLFHKYPDSRATDTLSYSTVTLTTSSLPTRKTSQAANPSIVGQDEAQLQGARNRRPTAEQYTKCWQDLKQQKFTIDAEPSETVRRVSLPGTNEC